MNKCKLFNCELCGVKLTSDLISTQHYAGKAHEKKVVVALQEYAKVNVCYHHHSGILKGLSHKIDIWLLITCVVSFRPK